MHTEPAETAPSIPLPKRGRHYGGLDRAHVELAAYREEKQIVKEESLHNGTKAVTDEHGNTSIVQETPLETAADLMKSERVEVEGYSREYLREVVAKASSGEVVGGEGKADIEKVKQLFGENVTAAVDPSKVDSSRASPADPFVAQAQSPFGAREVAAIAAKAPQAENKAAPAATV